MPVIATNTAANSALRYLNINSDEQTSTLSKLASGSRITKASDDAAGLAIATRISSDVSTLDTAATNASQASSILETADGGLANIADILQRMKSLATQADSGAVTTQERTYLQAEYSQLISEINGIASSTRYNGVSLLDGTGVYASGVSFMVGTSSADTISVTIADADATALGVNGTSVSGADTSAAMAALTAIDAALNTVLTARANIGATESRFEFRSSQIATSSENLDAAQSAIMDADVAEEESKLASEDVLTQAAVAALAQANQMPQNLLKLLQ